MARKAAKLIEPGWLERARKVLHRELDRVLDRLRTCQGCGTVFLDSSTNRSRRWRSMARCGNRSKVRAFRAKGE